MFSFQRAVTEGLAAAGAHIDKEDWPENRESDEFFRWNETLFEVLDAMCVGNFVSPFRQNVCLLGIVTPTRDNTAHFFNNRLGPATLHWRGLGAGFWKSFARHKDATRFLSGVREWNELANDSKCLKRWRGELILSCLTWQTWFFKRAETHADAYSHKTDEWTTSNLQTSLNHPGWGFTIYPFALFEPAVTRRNT